MPAAAELPHHRGRIHLRLPAAAHQHHPVPHLADGEEDAHPLHVAQFVHEERQVPHVLLPPRLGDHHLDPADRVRPGPLEQVVEQGDLPGGQVLGEDVGHLGELRPAGEQVRRGEVVVHRGRREAERARVLVDPEHHHRRLVRRDGDPPLLEDLDEDRRGRADAPDHLEVALHVGVLVGMVVVDVDRNARAADQLPEDPDAGAAADVDQDEAGHLVEVDLAGLAHRQVVEGGLDEEPLDRLLLRPRQDADRLGVKLARRQHRRDRVEVGVQVGGDDVHGAATPGGGACGGRPAAVPG